MLDVNVVKQALEEYLNKKHEYIDDNLVVLADDIIDRDKYWVFFYINKRYLETSDLSNMIVGNAPIIINKLTGEKYTTGTAYPIAYYMEEYEKKLA